MTSNNTTPETDTHVTPDAVTDPLADAVTEPSTGTRSVATPDFYTYPWTGITGMEHSEAYVKLTFSDGTRLDAHEWWLRESVVTEGACDPTTREGTLDPADIADDLALTSVAVDPDGALTVAFTDGTTGRIHPGWLHHVAVGRHQANAHLPPIEVWTAATMNEPPTFDGRAVLSSDDELRVFLDALCSYGIARLTRVPGEGEGSMPEGLAAITDRIGVRRSTNFGDIWNVKAEIRDNSENSTANSGLRLGPHTDLPTRETPPGFQFLHCWVNSVPGGWSRMTDGAAVVAHLEAEEPETYEALTTLNWVFFNRSREHDHRWSGPMIDLGVPGSPLTIRAFYPVRAFPDMDPVDVPRAYRAAKRFHQLGADPRFEIGYPFRDGDMVVFDNRRVLHGRDAFDPGGGVRHLRGSYMDHDEIYSRLRVLTRHHQQRHQSLFAHN